MATTLESRARTDVRRLFGPHGAPMFREDGAPMRAIGRLDVQRGAGWLSRLLARLGGLPRAGAAVPVELAVESGPRGLLWTRIFDGVPIRSDLRERGGDLVEVFGPIRLAFRLEPAGAWVAWRQTGMWLGPFPVPRALSLRVTARTRVADPGWWVEVRVDAPCAGLLVAWHGFMEAL